MLLPPTVRVQLPMLVEFALMANVAFPEPSVVTFPLIVVVPLVKATATSVLGVRPVIVKLRMIPEGARAKPAPSGEGGNSGGPSTEG